MTDKPTVHLLYLDYICNGLTTGEVLADAIEECGNEFLADELRVLLGCHPWRGSSDFIPNWCELFHRWVGNNP